jgi:TetR/AcrR family transcriptional regulator
LLNDREVRMEEKATLPRKEREKLARRAEIQGAARTVFAEKGFEAATLEEIAERAELAKGTIYGYFENKETLFFSLIEEILEGQARILREVHEKDMNATEKLSEVIRRYVFYLSERKDLFRILMGQSGGLTGNIRDEIRQKYFQIHRHQLASLVSILQEGVQKSELRDLPAQAMAYVIVGLIHGAMIPLVITQDMRDEEQVIRTITEVLLNGVRK